MKKIRSNPAKGLLKNTGKLKVAAYCRVSTEMESQQSSIDIQIRYYTDLIQRYPERGMILGGSDSRRWQRTESKRTDHQSGSCGLPVSDP